MSSITLHITYYKGRSCIAGNNSTTSLTRHTYTSSNSTYELESAGYLLKLKHTIYIFVTKPLVILIIIAFYVINDFILIGMFLLNHL